MDTEKIVKVNYPTWQPAPPNTNISPLIKFGRWTALILGISYGFLRHKYLQRRADKNKALRDSRLVIRAKANLIEKERNYIEQMKELERQLNAKILPD